MPARSLVARLPTAIILVALPRVVAKTFRESLLDLARDRIEVQFSDPNCCDKPNRKDGITLRLSKKDQPCGGNDVPISFLEFDIDGARPVDAFNALSDVESEPSWNPHCISKTELGKFHQLRARAFTSIFSAGPLANREAHEWQVLEANFTSEEFWILSSTMNNDELRQQMPTDPFAVEMQNCLGAYRLTPTPNGTHAVMTMQTNAHPAPFSARYVAKWAWGESVAWADAARGWVLKQAQLGWNATQTSVPAWMLTDEVCVPPLPDTSLKEALLSKAGFELHSVERGPEDTPVRLHNNEVFRTWRRDMACGGNGVPRYSTPVWQAEFRVPEVSPADVYNALLKMLGEEHVDVIGFHGGARGVHRLYQWPQIGWHAWKPRELWEWQSASYEGATDTYLVAVSSMVYDKSSMFKGTSENKSYIEAFQCLAAYELSPDISSGTRVHMSFHENPNVGAFLTFTTPWKNYQQNTLVTWASSLSTKALRSSQQRGSGAQLHVDDDALLLLTPKPPGRNATATIADVLAVDNGSHLKEFASLDLPRVLNVSGATPAKFKQRASEVFGLSRLFRANFTTQEEATFSSGTAKDTIELQKQGATLAVFQYYAIANIACNSGPRILDVSHSVKGNGLRVKLGIVALVLFFVCVGNPWFGALCWCYKRRWWWQRELKHAKLQEPLLAGPGTITCLNLNLNTFPLIQNAPVMNYGLKNCGSETSMFSEHLDGEMLRTLEFKYCRSEASIISMNLGEDTPRTRPRRNSWPPRNRPIIDA